MKTDHFLVKESVKKDNKWQDLCHGIKIINSFNQEDLQCQYKNQPRVCREKALL